MNVKSLSLSSLLESKQGEHKRKENRASIAFGFCSLHFGGLTAFSYLYPNERLPFDVVNQDETILSIFVVSDVYLNFYLTPLAYSMQYAKSCITTVGRS